MDNDDRGPNLLGVLWFLVASATLFLTLRVFAKCFRRCGLWWDDYILIASWICLVIEVGVMTSSVSLGFGKHVSAVNPRHIPMLLLEGSLATLFSVLAATWSKTSWALTLLRLCTALPRMRMTLWFIIVSVNGLMYLTIIMKFVQCNPVAKNWEMSLGGTCWPKQVFVGFAITSGCYSALMDFALALLPWVLLKDMRMRRREKFGVVIAMSMGVFAGATAIVKSVKILVDRSSDYTYATVDLSIWGTAEISTTIMAASIPVLRMLVLQVKSSLDQSKYANMDWQERGFKVPSTVGTSTAPRLDTQQPMSPIFDSKSPQRVFSDHQYDGVSRPKG